MEGDNLTDVNTYNVTEPWLQTQCQLGEGPHFDPVQNVLRFVDIIGQTIHTVDINKGASSHQIAAKLDISVGVTADIEDNDEEFVFAGKEGYGIFDKSTGNYRYIKKVWTETEAAEGKPHRMRANDGNVDSYGRFWAGMMNDPLVQEVTPEGVLFRLDPDLSLHRMMTGVSIPNGISWSPDDKIMYFTDSETKRIDMFDFDPKTCAMSNRRPFFTVSEEGGVPDGHCWDEEGCMWVACHGTSKVYRLSEAGKVLAVVKCPVAQVTCPRLVGEELVITSERKPKESVSPEEDAKYQGCVFKVNVGVRGRAMSKFKLRANT